MFEKDAPDLSVESLTESDAAIKRFFSNPEVQYIGSTSGCGCDFPHVILQNGQWPTLEDTEKDELDIARDIFDRRNREALVALLRTTGNKMVELYGVWDGGNESFDKPPEAEEDISVDRLLDSNFRFKEQGFYRVSGETNHPIRANSLVSRSAVSEARMGRMRTRARRDCALSIQRLEGSRSGLRRTRVMQIQLRKSRCGSTPGETRESTAPRRENVRVAENSNVVRRG